MLHSIKVGDVLVTYDEDTSVILENGKPTDRFHPTFIPNGQGDEDVDFFGVVDYNTGTHYDLKGNKNEIVDESNIGF
jgi:hypothetical protein